MMVTHEKLQRLIRRVATPFAIAVILTLSGCAPEESNNNNQGGQPLTSENTLNRTSKEINNELSLLFERQTSTIELEGGRKLKCFICSFEPSKVSDIIQSENFRYSAILNEAMISFDSNPFLPASLDDPKKGFVIVRRFDNEPLPTASLILNILGLPEDSYSVIFIGDGTLDETAGVDLNLTFVRTDSKYMVGAYLDFPPLANAGGSCPFSTIN